MNEICTLCRLNLPKYPIINEAMAFCCHGCLVVYQILSAQNRLQDYRDNPLFLQALGSGLISNPQFIDEIEKKTIDTPQHEFEHLHLEIKDLWCPSCAEIIRLIFLREKGVKGCIVDYSTDLASIEFSPRHLSKEKIVGIINALGYHPEPFNNYESSHLPFSLYLRFIIAAFFTLNIMMMAYPLYATYFDFDDQGYGLLFAWISGIAALPVVAYSGWPIFQRAWHSLWAKLMGMEILVVIGVVSAFGLSLFELFQGKTRVYFDSMTTIITFVLLGKIVEAKAKFSAKESLAKLSRSIPRKGRKRFENGELKFVPVKELKQGDVVIAGLGEKIILDGLVIEGEGSLNESLMTGESLPVHKKIGCTVLCGTVVQQGWIAYRITSKENDSALHSILTMVQQDISQKISYLRPVDAVVRWFVPTVILISLATLVFWWRDSQEQAILNAISVLLISCPCAIGIAAPLVESKLLQCLANMGVIVRNRGCLSLLGKETVFIFDKTGTLTEGNFRVLSGLEVLHDDELQILKGLASVSHHPVAQAIAKAIKVPGKSLFSLQEFPGSGIQGVFNGSQYKLGSAAFVQIYRENVGSFITQVYFSQDEKCLCEIRLGDQLKKDAAECIAALNCATTLLISGDGETTVKAVASACGIQSYHHGITPAQKRALLEDFRNQGHTVAMLGDGINDAPALTRAHIGISVVSAADISIHVSDILLTTDRLNIIPKMRTLALTSHRIIKQNLFWAFIYNGVGIALASCGWLNPVFAAAAMVSSSLIVIANAQRLRTNAN